jgi:hypothetical protein
MVTDDLLSVSFWGQLYAFHEAFLDALLDPPDSG